MPGEIYVSYHLAITNSGQMQKRQDVRNEKYRVFGEGGTKRSLPDARNFLILFSLLHACYFAYNVTNCSLRWI